LVMSLKVMPKRTSIWFRNFVHKLSEAKDFQDAFRVQTEFMQSQFAALGEQTKNLSEACGKSAAGVFNKSFKNVA
jgi:hypothetical protein